MANKARAENDRMVQTMRETEGQCGEWQTKTGLKLLERDRGENSKQVEDGRQGKGKKMVDMKQYGERRIREQSRELQITKIECLTESG